MQIGGGHNFQCKQVEGGGNISVQVFRGGGKISVHRHLKANTSLIHHEGGGQNFKGAFKGGGVGRDCQGGS